MEKIKIFVPFLSHPSRNRKFQKNSKKIHKIKKYHYGFILNQNRLDKAEEGRKQKLSFRFVLALRVIEIFKKNSKKLKKYHYGFISNQNRLEMVEK